MWVTEKLETSNLCRLALMSKHYISEEGEMNHSLFHTCIILTQVIVSANHIKCDRVYVVYGVTVIK